MTAVDGADPGPAGWLLTGDSPAARVQRSAGNKGRYLHELTRLGANVPPFCVIAVEAFQ
jgi:phosphoenolpyruvate synthase/pyruvate phosphate dikinase